MNCVFRALFSLPFTFSLCVFVHFGVYILLLLYKLTLSLFYSFYNLALDEKVDRSKFAENVGCFVNF